MHKRIWTGTIALVALLGLIACGSTVSSGGGGTVAKDTVNGADVALAADAEADVAADDIAADDVAADDVAAEDVAQDIAPDIKQPVKTHGALVNPPLEPIAALTKVVDSTGAKMTPDALQGHWTVLWFYPAASTAG